MILEEGKDMDIKTKEIYSEVFSVLNMLGKDYITKLPTKLYQLIKEEKNNEYNPQYNSTIALEQQNIKKEALSMIALFHLNYWCDSQEEKQKLKDLFNENEVKYQAELKEKYNPDNLFKKKENQNNFEEQVEQMSMVEYKENIFKRIINKILNILKFRKE